MDQIAYEPFSFMPFLSSANSIKANPFYKLDIPVSSRQFVIADIHGCYHTFRELLNQISLSRNDCLFLLGDIIGRGKHSQAVLDLIIKLIQDGYTIYPLRGNHEQMLLERHKKIYSPDDFALPLRPKNVGLLDSSNKIKAEYVGFISNLPFYYETDDFLFSHAGFNFDRQDFLSDFESMIWISEMPEGTSSLNKRIILGHKPITLIEIRKAMEKEKKIIRLDNGCIYRRSGMGNLVALELQSMRLYVQKNID